MKPARDVAARLQLRRRIHFTESNYHQTVGSHGTEPQLRCCLLGQPEEDPSEQHNIHRWLNRRYRSYLVLLWTAIADYAGLGAR